MTVPALTYLQSLRRILIRAGCTVAALTLVTVAALAWQRQGMEQAVELADGHVPMKAEDDRIGGGQSVARLARRGRDNVLLCHLVKTNGWAYCKLNIDLMHGMQGLDLSRFDALRIDLDYKGPGVGKLGLIVVNMEEGLTHPDDWKTYKINQIDAVDVPVNGRLEVPLKWLGVAQWWKDMAKPPVEHSYVRIDNASRIELTMGGWAPDGEHEVALKSVRLHGKLVSQTRLLQGLVGLWFATALAWLAALAWSLRRQLAASNAERAKLAGINVALKLEAQELTGQAHHDPLTGVLNRQGLRAALMSTSTLLTDPMSIVFIDIDHFKAVNDTHGHDVGDDVLRTFADVLAAGIRQSDRLVRWGGEEFLIVCSMTDVHQATALAEKLRRQLHRTVWPAGLRMTASFGVAQHHKEAEMSVAIKRADEELYKAKTGGRDRVQAYLLPD
jgi:diguanylate cyclase (GGDEF)-like protein